MIKILHDWTWINSTRRMADYLLSPSERGRGAISSPEGERFRPAVKYIASTKRSRSFRALKALIRVIVWGRGRKGSDKCFFKSAA